MPMKVKREFPWKALGLFVLTLVIWTVGWEVAKTLNSYKTDTKILQLVPELEGAKAVRLDYTPTIYEKSVFTKDEAFNAHFIKINGTWYYWKKTLE